MGILLRESQFSGPAPSEASGLVYAFVPAHGHSATGAVSRELSRVLAESHGLTVLLADFYARGFPVWGTMEAPLRLDRKSWAEFITEGAWFDSLEAREAHPREIPRLLDHARSKYAVTCADLRGAKEIAAVEVLRNSDAIFLITESDKASVELAKFKAAWLRSMGLEENAAVVLREVPGGAGALHAEQRIGLPVCEKLTGGETIERLAAWLRPECVCAPRHDWRGLTARS